MSIGSESLSAFRLSKFQRLKLALETSSNCEFAGHIPSPGEGEETSFSPSLAVKSVDMVMENRVLMKFRKS